MTEEQNIKLNNARKMIKELGSVVIAFSGGVDSSLLAKISYEQLRENSLAITVRSPLVPDSDYRDAIAVAKIIGIRHEFVDIEALEIEEVRMNTPNRCYACKRAIMQQMKSLADFKGYKYVVEGSNMDDLNDYRPGAKAVKELDILSPLKESNMDKSDIREISKHFALPTWDKPSMACLASRFPYGVEISEDKLKKIETAENHLSDYGIKQCRIRYHDDIARIEVAEEDFQKVVSNRANIVRYIKGLGFNYVTLDLSGYHTGSMNRTIGKER